MTPAHRRNHLLAHASRAEAVRIAELLRHETMGGALLLLATVLALVCANSPAAGLYDTIRETRLGPASLHLDLTVAQWASDGLLAVFFFLVGLELKQEFVAGDLSSPRRALVPVLAACGGVAVPALIYTGLTVSHPAAQPGWAISTATDIAFAVAALSIVGRHLPSGLRTFLLTLAVADDLIAIIIIAVFFTDSISWLPLAGAVVVIALFAVLTHRFRAFFGRRRSPAWTLLLPLGIVAWALVHASGLHATLAGVALGLAVPVQRSDGNPDAPGLAGIFEHRFRPLSSGFAAPVFAFFAAGVSFGGAEGFKSAMADPITTSVIVALVLGKPLGIVGTTALASAATGDGLADGVGWLDMIGVGLLGGIGFTVSLLVGELSFGAGTPPTAHATIGVLLGSAVAALLGGTWLAVRDRAHARGIPALDAD